MFFYLEFSSPRFVDISRLEIGNPGMGGTEYITLCLVKELSQRQNFEIAVISNSDLILSQSIPTFKLSLQEAIDYVGHVNGVLIFRPTINLSQGVEEAINTTSASLVAWTHVTPSSVTMDKLSKARSIKAVVSLGLRQYFNYVEHSVINKTIVIPNATYLPNAFPTQNSGEIYISYQGSLVPQKGFHLLAKVWPKIVSKHPNLKLKVIGSGSLYSEKAQLGELGIAHPEYEKRILKYLGSHIDSVSFLGTIGGEAKNFILKNSYIGIVNPSGETEVSPLSALEFQAYSIPVISARKFGIIDTVRNRETGLLFRNIHLMPKHISSLIQNVDRRNRLAANCLPFIQENFNIQDFVDKWSNLLSNLERKHDLKVRIIDVKQCRELIALLNVRFFRIVGIGSPPFSIYGIENFLRKILQNTKVFLQRKLQN